MRFDLTDSQFCICGVRGQRLIDWRYGSRGQLWGHTCMELLAKIINGIHDAILIFAGLAFLAFALWVLTHILGMV